MKLDDLTEKIGGYLVNEIAPKCDSFVTKFALGAAASATGKKRIAEMLVSIVPMIADENGEFSADAVRDLLVSGIRVSGKMPILGGLVTLDEADINKFCEGL